MQIVEWMLEEKIAHHWKQAQNIIVGLKLFDLYNEKKFDEIKARARLYRTWRNAGENVQASYANAIAGKPAPEQLLQPHCGHPVASVMQADEGTAWCADCEAEANNEALTNNQCVGDPSL